MSGVGQMYPWQSDPAGFLQSILGYTPRITSTTRSPEHNLEVGGVPNSRHLPGPNGYGNAIDFVPQNYGHDMAALSRAPRGELLNEGNHIHVSFNPPAAGAAPTVDPDEALLSAHASGAGTDPDEALLQAHVDAPANVAREAIAQTSTKPETYHDLTTRLMGSNAGAFMQGATGLGYGVNQDVYKGLQALTSLGGMAPNTVSDYFGNTANAVTDRWKAENQAYAHARQAVGNPGSPLNEVAGSVLSPVNAIQTLVPGKYGSRIQQLGRMLTQGAEYGVEQPADTRDPNFWGTKALAADIGAGGSYLGNKAGNFVSGVVSPVIRDSVKTLQDAGIPLTVGQTMGGAMHRLEDAATSLPFVGDVIKNRHFESYAGLSRAAVQRGLDQIGVDLPEGLSGRKAISFAQDHFDDAYDRVLGSGVSATATPELASNLANIVNNPLDYGLSTSSIPDLKDIVDKKIIGRAQKGGVFDADSLKAVQSDLSTLIRQRVTGNASPTDHGIAQATRDMKIAFNNFVADQNPEAANELGAINLGYAHLARAEKAANYTVSTPGSSGAEGIFSPSQYARALKEGASRRQLASGTAMDQDLANAALEVLPPTVPDSGTAMRHLTQLAIGAGAAGLAGEKLPMGEYLGPAAAGAAGVTSALMAAGSKPAQRAMVYALTRRPAQAAALGQILRQSGPAIGRGAALIPFLSQIEATPNQ